MTPEEWVEIVDWVQQRWPNGWHDEQDVAYYDDLKRFDASDVWVAVFAIYSKGLAFPPNGSMIMAKVLDKTKDRAEQARYDTPALPAAVGGLPVGGWLDKWYPGERVSWSEHIVRVHASKGPCGSRFCDMHVKAK